jgi:phosphonatase-like hydrolase
MRLIVCDMAGTTVQDDGRVARCFSQALQAFGVENAAGIQTHMGRGKMTAIRALVGPAQAQECFDQFRDLLEHDYMLNPARATPGAVDLFRWAKNKDLEVALNTGFYSAVTDLILEQLGWIQQGLVGAVICDDDVFQGRPAPYMIYKAMMVHGVYDVRDVVYVGDTRADMMAGHNARVRVNIGVTTGGEQPVDLYKAGAHAVLKDASKVIDLLS